MSFVSPDYGDGKVYAHKRVGINIKLIRQRPEHDLRCYFLVLLFLQLLVLRLYPLLKLFY